MKEIKNAMKKLAEINQNYIITYTKLVELRQHSPIFHNVYIIFFYKEI